MDEEMTTKDDGLTDDEEPKEGELDGDELGDDLDVDPDLLDGDIEE